jgi:hypothetical protein
MPCIASSFRIAHKPCRSCNAIKSREWLNLIYKIAGGLSCRTDNVCSWHKTDLVASSLDVRSQGQSRSGVEASMSRSSSNVVLRHMSCDENASLIDMTVQVGFLFFLNANFLPMNQGNRSTGRVA